MSKRLRQQIDMLNTELSCLKQRLMDILGRVGLLEGHVFGPSQYSSSDQAFSYDESKSLRARVTHLETMHRPRCAICGRLLPLPDKHPAPAQTWTLADSERAAQAQAKEDGK